MLPAMSTFGAKTETDPPAATVTPAPAAIMMRASPLFTESPPRLLRGLSS